MKGPRSRVFPARIQVRGSTPFALSRQLNEFGKSVITPRIVIDLIL